MLHSVSGDCEHCDNCDGKMFLCERNMCRWNDGEVDCDECNGSGMAEGKECKTCKGKGYVQCDHPEVEICNSCGEGLKVLGVKTPEDIKKIIK